MKRFPALMIRYSLFLILYLPSLIPYFSPAQNIGIGTNSPNASAILDINSTNKGLLIPRLTNAQMSSLVSPATGLTVYNTTDSSYYTKRPGGWRKVSYGDDNLWKKTNNNNLYSLNGNFVGINYPQASSSFIGLHAPLQTALAIGNTVAYFGDGTQGVSLVGSYPGVFFNSYFNNGVKAMSAGETGNITLNQASLPYYEFSFGDYASVSDQPVSNHVMMALRYDGHLYVGNTSTNFSRAAFEQQGAVSATAAIFGGDGSGISLQHNWPAIGFNSYLDGGGHKSIAQGYGAQLGLNQQNGSLYLVSFPFNANANTAFNNYTQKFYISQKGKIGLGTDDPYADIEIIQRPNVYDGSDEDIDRGITYNGVVTVPDGSRPIKWNTHIGYGAIGQFSDQYNYSFWVSADNIAPAAVAAINNDGSYYQASDRELKKDIIPLNRPACLERINRLKPSSYRFKTQADDRPLTYGFVAQELEEIFPEMVMTTKTNKLVSYSALIPVLTAGMQEQQQQIDKLKNEIAELKKLLIEKK